MLPDNNYTNNIFINCPFDQEFKPLLDAMIFTIFDCGFIPRCALEEDDSGEVRIDKIARIIADCKYGVHDISRIELCENTKLPRFNMPLELGMFLGAKRYGSEQQKKKVSLIMDSQQWRYQIYISDIAGQDPRAHENKIENVIKILRDWLNSASRRKTIPGGTAILKRYNQFLGELPAICQVGELELQELTYNDLTTFISAWLQESS